MKNRASYAFEQSVQWIIVIVAWLFCSFALIGIGWTIIAAGDAFGPIACLIVIMFWLLVAVFVYHFVEYDGKNS